MKTRTEKANDRAASNAIRLSRQYNLEQVAAGRVVDADSLADLIGAGLATAKDVVNNRRGGRWKTTVVLTDAGRELLAR